MLRTFKVPSFHFIKWQSFRNEWALVYLSVYACIWASLNHTLVCLHVATELGKTILKTRLLLCLPFPKQLCVSAHLGNTPALLCTTSRLCENFQITYSGWEAGFLIWYQFDTWRRERPTRVLTKKYEGFKAKVVWSIFSWRQMRRSVSTKEIPI